MSKRAKRVLLGLALVVAPPVAALVIASLAVSVDRHAQSSNQPAPAIWDTLFPLALIVSFLSVPYGIYLVYRALKSDA